MGKKEDLAAEQARDERDDAVEALFDEAKEMYVDSVGSSFTLMMLDDEALRNVLRLAYEEWRQKE